MSSSIEALQQRLEQVEAERDALAAHVERLRQLWPPLSSDISALFDQQPQNHSDGSYLVDGQSACEFAKALNDSPSTSLASRDAHPDDLAVDRFAAAMKTKLAGARDKGRSGWDNHELCSAEFLADLLVGHVSKGNAGNLEDVANLAMMLHQRGDDPVAVAQALARRDARVKAEALESLASSSLVGDLHKELIRRCAEEYRQQAEGGGDE